MGTAMRAVWYFGEATNLHSLQIDGRQLLFSITNGVNLASLIHLWISVFGMEFIWFH